MDTISWGGRRYPPANFLAGLASMPLIALSRLLEVALLRLKLLELRIDEFKMLSDVFKISVAAILDKLSVEGDETKLDL